MNVRRCMTSGFYPQWGPIRLAVAIDDLIALRLEGRDPFIDRGVAGVDIRRVAKPQLDPGGFEQTVKLFVGQLNEQVGEELPPLLTDRRIDERAGQRLREVRHTPASVLPDRRARPLD